MKKKYWIGKKFLTLNALKSKKVSKKIFLILNALF